MTHTLITFLGRVPKIEKHYCSTRYRFPDGSVEGPTAFVGWNLRRRLEPDRLVVLGTAGSMWDHLFERDIALGEEGEDGRLRLQEATEQRRVEQGLLDEVAPFLERRLGCSVHLIVIPYGHDETEQREILQCIAKEVGHKQQISLDVSHGFRHLPMLGLLSALHLRVTRRATIAGIYYGYYDQDIDEGLVYDLSGLLHIADWIGALHSFDKDGDYGVFADLLDADGLEKTQTNHLRRAAFLERANNAWNARSELASFDKALSAGIPGTGSLFAEPLRERIRWHKSARLYSWQRELAWEYLDRGDYVRAVIFSQEAFVTRLIQKPEREWDYKDRDHARDDFDAGNRGPQHLKDDYRRLTKLRNTLAHGNRPDDDKVATIVKDEPRLAAELRRLLKNLLN